MSTRGVRGSWYQPTKIIDLNKEPPGDNQDQVGTSNQVGPQNVQGSQERHSTVRDAFYVDDSEDDLTESSPRAFNEAKRNSRRNRRINLDDSDSEEQTRATRKRRRNNTLNASIINLESNSNSTRESATAQKEPTFSCPICMGPLVEEMSTKCGHIFCKLCLKVAITAQGKCPTCRKKVHLKDLIRVFLPSTC